ncbi:MAG: heterodisulfide reductase subunit F [Planctomycetes bacterium]|nr:heterodisulfide reductase subunit F [Planctomycetota bacterium]
MSVRNPYLPYPTRIEAVAIENGARDIKTFRLAFEDPAHAAEFRHLPGQFAELSLPGVGEAPFGIASSPTEAGYILFSVKRTGLFTGELHSLEPGAPIGVRGPMGKPFPWERMEGRNLLIIGGGFAFTTLRAAVKYVLDPANRPRFGSVLVIYGARTPDELMYKDELAAWQARDDLQVHLTVDVADKPWAHHVGVVTKVLDGLKPSSENTLAIACGPPIMIRFTLLSLANLGFSDDAVILSLEMRMKCGIGKCGRCNIGSKYVCRDGPVFTRDELKALPAEY